MTNNSKPLLPVNPKGLDDIASALLDGGSPSSNEEEVRPATISNPERRIILPTRTHGSYSYPDIVVDMHRLGYDASVEKAAKELGITAANSGKEKEGHGYVGNINWETALKLNQRLGNFTLNPRQFIDLKELLEAGIDKNKKVYDGKGKALDLKVIRQIYNEITEVREPWRSEWLDAKFLDIGGALRINYGHRLVNGNLTADKSEVLEAYVGENSWIDVNSFNRQGLPTKKSSTQKLYFRYPVNGAVAGFDAYSGGTDLVCSWDPSGTAGCGLGVRAARKK